MIKIEIKLKSFEQYYLNKTLLQLKAILIFFNISFSNEIKLPQKIKKFTILRSPHIDKKSREQFEIKRFKNLLTVEITDFKLACLIIEILKNSSFSGVQLEIYVKSFNYN